MPEWAWQVAVLLVTSLVTGGSIYGAIRADLRNLHARISRAEGHLDQLIFGRK